MSLLSAPLVPSGDNKPCHLNKQQKSDKKALLVTQELKEILIGLLLGDLYAQKQKASINARLQFKQSTIHKDYLLHLHDLFKEYCGSNPKTSFISLKEKIHGSMRFYTYSLPCFNEFYNLFYFEGKKFIPTNIGSLLTLLGLAYWICDDGSFYKSTKTVVLCTESFIMEEVELLISVLNDKWDLDSYKKKHQMVFSSSTGCGWAKNLIN
uniref:LAGLIDADG homing endonuclease n=1 Tax=Rhizoctonia solani TaxID=456999 RepID=A0A8E8L8B3_9AGAM|nr:LAGLIDADG homing endonuclease [Rhizoctonia solani]